MRLLKQALAVLGALVVVAAMVALVAPKRARAVETLLVKVVPGTTTHVGQNESQLVSLYCVHPGYCLAISPDGTASGTYVVPSGYTLIVTDYQFTAPTGTGTPGAFGTDVLFNSNTQNTLAYAGGLTDNFGSTYAHEHYATGIRVGSGVTIEDLGASAVGSAYAYVQGYLVPND